MKEITVESIIDNVTPVTAFVEEELEAHDCPMKALMQINVAIDEIFSNIAFYAYRPGKGDITVQVDFDDTPAVKITFIDSGMPYDPLAKEDPDVTLSAEERGIGGLGIFIVKKTMDNVEYRNVDGKNILTLTKNI